MEATEFDVIVIGAGIAGATAAAALAADRRVALIEAEEAAGYHTTGRSAAMWILNYGPPDVRLLTRLSRGFLADPPEGFTEATLMHRRPVLYLAPAEQRAALAAAVAEGEGVREIAPAAARALVPALRPGYAAAAAIEEDAFDLDVAALHQGFLRALTRRGGVLGLRRRSQRIARAGATWRVETAAGDTLAAPVVVNAAGAWGDEVATQAGVAPIGLVARRRTAAVVDPAPQAVADWPMTMDIAGTWYMRPEARTRLMVSPADATDDIARDVRPEEIDIALGIDRMQAAMDVPVRRVERSWAGLRSFAPDGSLVLGWDARAEGFFWSVGQGGYGIQTSPAAGRLVADLVAGRAPGPAGAVLAAVDPSRFR
jgi:D-arginine dehydrogenase